MPDRVTARGHQKGISREVARLSTLSEDDLEAELAPAEPESDDTA
jgi:hypothetical protein